MKKIAITNQEQQTLYNQKQGQQIPNVNSRVPSNQVSKVQVPVAVKPGGTSDLKTKLKQLYLTHDTIPGLIEDEDNGKHKISDYYVKLQMVMNESGGDRQKAYAHDQISGEKIGIDVGSIFSKIDDNHPEVGKVLLLGAPGVGKTTLLHHMAYSWAKDAVWQGQFDYVFRVRLKDLLDTGWSSNYDVKTELRQDKLACFIHYCLKSQENKGSKLAIRPSEIIEIINKDKVLLLLDGYDEIAHLAKRNLVNHSDYREIIESVFEYKNVVISSRPNAVGIDLKSKFERVIENKGLDPQGIGEFIDRKFGDSKSQDGAALSKSLKGFLQKNAGVMDMCQVPINIALISLIWSDNGFREKFTNGSDFNIGQLYHEVILWLGKRYLTKVEGVDPSQLLKGNILEREELKFLTKVAHQSFTETGKLVTNEVVSNNIGKLNLPKVIKFGLLRPEGESTDVANCSYQFIHLTFQEYLTAYHLKEQLAKDKVVAKEAATIIAQHRNEPKYQVTLKFLAGLVASDQSQNAKTIVTRFWEAVSVNLEGTIELGLESKVGLFMHLLSQSKIKGQFDSRIPNLEKIKQLIDTTILVDISKWQQQITESGYLSPQLVTQVKNIIALAATKGEKSPYLKAATEIVANFANIGVFGNNEALFAQFMDFVKSKDWQVQKLGLEKAAKFVSQSIPQGKLEDAVKVASSLLENGNLASGIGVLLANICEVIKPSLVFDSLKAAMDNAKKANDSRQYKEELEANTTLILTKVAKTLPSELKNIFTLIDGSELFHNRYNSYNSYKKIKAVKEVTQALYPSPQEKAQEVVVFLKSWLIEKGEYSSYVVGYNLAKFFNVASKDEIKASIPQLKKFIFNSDDELRKMLVSATAKLAARMSKEEMKEILTVLKPLPKSAYGNIAYAELHTAKEMSVVVSQEEAKAAAVSLIPFIVDSSKYSASIKKIFEDFTKLYQCEVTDTSMQGLWLQIKESLATNNAKVKLTTLSMLSNLIWLMQEQDVETAFTTVKPFLVDEDSGVKEKALSVINGLIQHSPGNVVKKVLVMRKSLDDSTQYTLLTTIAESKFADKLSEQEAKEILSLVKPLISDQSSNVRNVRYNTVKLIKALADTFKDQVKELLPELKVLLNEKFVGSIAGIAHILPEKEQKELWFIIKRLLANSSEDIKQSTAYTVAELSNLIPKEEISEIFELLKSFYLTASIDSMDYGVVMAMGRLAQVAPEEERKKIFTVIKDIIKGDKSSARCVYFEAAAKQLSELISLGLVPEAEINEAAEIIKSEYAKFIASKKDSNIMTDAFDYGLYGVASALKTAELVEWLKDPLLHIRDIAKQEIISRLNYIDKKSWHNDAGKQQALTHLRVPAFSKLVDETKDSSDDADKEIHDGAGRALQSIAAEISDAGITWLGGCINELPNIPEVAAFLKTVCHKILSKGSLTQEQAVFLSDVIVKKGITASFNLSDKIILLDDTSYQIAEGGSLLDQIVEQVLAKSQDAIAKQYREHNPVFVNTESVLEKAATDIKDVSIVDGAELKSNVWKVSLLHRSNHEKVAPSEVFVLLEKSSYTGEHLIRKIAFKNGKLVLEKDYVAHPYKVDVLRKEIFGEMEYSSEVGKARYYGSVYEVQMDIEAQLVSIKQGKLTAKSNDPCTALYQFTSSLLSGKSVALELSGNWQSYVSYTGKMVKEFDKAKLLKADSKLVRRDSADFELKGKVTQQGVKLEKQEQVLEISGTNTRAQINQELENLKVTSPELYSYCNSFIWTLQSYIDAYLIADKGVLSVAQDSSTTEDIARYSANKLASAALGAIPFIGEFADIILDGVNTAIDAAKADKKQNKIQTLNDIICSNHKLKSDVELSIGLAALEIVKSANKQAQIKKPFEKSNILLTVAHAISDKAGHIKDKILQNKTITTTKQAELAIQDVIGLLAYMYKNYYEVKANKNGVTFSKQISEIVSSNGLESVIKSAMIADRQLMAEISAKIGQDTLTNIETKAQKGTWLINGVKGYLDDSSMEKCLGKNLLQAEVDVARMIMFKHICKGIMSNTGANKDFTCVENFAKQYPQLIEKMANEYPDLFVDKSIAEIALKTNSDLKGFVISCLQSSTNDFIFTGSSLVQRVTRDDLEKMEVKIGSDELEKVKKKAVGDTMAKIRIAIGKEVTEYLEEKYLKEYIGNNPLSKELDAARMVIFKYICKSIHAQTKVLDDKLMTCAKEFAAKYPALIETIAQNHPELFASKAIAESIDQVKNNTLLLASVTKYFDGIKGKGLISHSGESYYDSHWYEYTKEAMDEVLKLRLESVKSTTDQEVKILSPSYVFDGSNASKLCNEISEEFHSLTNGGSIIIPLNLYGKHWVGIAIDQTEQGVKIEYLDSENSPMPDMLKSQLEKILKVAVNETHVTPQHYDNCGLETIENLVSHVCGYRPDEDSVIAIHSILMGDMLSA